MEKENKKKFYKKWWFWVIVVILLIGASSNSDTTNTSTQTSSINPIEESNTNLDSNIKENNSTQAQVVEVVIPDFSTMTQDEVKSWISTNKMNGNLTTAYSDTIAKDAFVSQSITAGTTSSQGSRITITYSLGKEPTMGEKNALSKAKSYLNYTAFSYKGLIEQLEYEGFSNEESTYGADNCGADWNEQAAKKAKSYMDYSSFSKSGLIEQLEYEGFTNEQAQYGATAVGY